MIVAIRAARLSGMLATYRRDSHRTRVLNSRWQTRSDPGFLKAISCCEYPNFSNTPDWVTQLSPTVLGGGSSTVPAEANLPFWRDHHPGRRRRHPSYLFI